MTVEEMKAALSQQAAELKEGMKAFAKSDDIQAEIKKITDDVEKLNIKGLENQLGELQKAAELQGELINQMKAGAPQKVESFRDALVKNADHFKKMLETSDAGNLKMVASRKSISGAQVTNDTVSYRESGITQIQRGQEWIRDKFNTVSLGANSHNVVTWVEQSTITDNSAMVAEVSTPAAQSGITWIERTLSSKRVKDFIKVSKDALKDFDFLNGEIRTLIEKNMRLKENAQLYAGDGIGLNIKGILAIAPEFVTAGIQLPDADIFGLITKGKTQIKKAGLDAYAPNQLILNPDEVDAMRLLKNKDGDYMNMAWAMGGLPSVGGLNIYENCLANPNSMLMGDFSYGTVYLWDELQIEIGYVGTDFTDGYVTIVAYQRENLRVKELEKTAFLKVTDVAAAIQAITK